MAISAHHGRGVPGLLDAVVDKLRAVPIVVRADTGSAARVSTQAPDGDVASAATGAWAAERGAAEGAEEGAGWVSSEDSASGAEGGAWDDLSEAAVVEAVGDADAFKLAVIGRPNVGKSSILNKLLNDERHVVHPDAGTTRDSVTSEFEWGGERILIADTAGIRRRMAGGSGREDIDRIAAHRARTMAKSANVTMLVFDASEGLVRQDLRIANLALTEMKSCVLVANKCDLLEERDLDELSEAVRARLPSLSHAPIVKVSARSGAGLSEAMDLVVEAARWRRERVPKQRLNELFQRAQVLRPLPFVKSSRLRIRYVTQGVTETPTFVFYMNKESGWHPSDERWMENIIRSQWPFTATPLRLVFRSDAALPGMVSKERDVRTRRQGRGAPPSAKHTRKKQRLH